MTEVTANEPTPIELAAPKENEYEVWAREESAPPSLLVVRVVGGENPMKIIDPAAGNTEVYSGHHYLEIVSYLREEEYIPVKGRMKLIES